jgi:hypothetical protein
MSDKDDFFSLFILLVGVIFILIATSNNKKIEQKPIINCGACHAENIDYSKGE